VGVECPDQCCCFSSTLTITQNGQSVTLSGPVNGSTCAAGTTALSTSFTLSTTGSTTGAFTFNSHRYFITETGDEIAVTDTVASYCKVLLFCSTNNCVAPVLFPQQQQQQSTATRALVSLILLFATTILSVVF